MIETLDLNIPLELSHAGVKGMKWGVRKDSATKTISGMKKRFKEKRLDQKVTKDIAKKNYRQRTQLYKLSDSQLQKKLNRINMENNYNKAVATQLQANRSRGANALKKATSSKVGKSVINSGLTAAATAYGGPGAGVVASAVTNSGNKKK